MGDGVTMISGEVTYDAEGNIMEDTREYEENSTPVYWSDWCQYYYHDVADEAVTFDASFIKLRENYPLSESAIQMGIRIIPGKSFCILCGRNLWLWSNIKYVDPDTGTDNLQTPSSRNIGFNINLIF